MEIEDAAKGDFVFQVGDIGTKFYIILQGSVSIQIPQQRDLITVLEEVNTLS